MAMRIITGQLKGRLLRTPEAIRPTEDRIRKALFDIIDPEGAVFLELFAGSGAVGLEALSRGAKQVTLVEKERACLAVIRENLLHLAMPGGEEGKTEVLPMEVEETLAFLCKKGRKFDIIFLDPPYYKGIAEKTLQSLGGYDILPRSGIVIVQHFRKDRLSGKAGELVLFRQSRYGDSLLSFYRKTQPDEQESDLSGDF